MKRTSTRAARLPRAVFLFLGALLVSLAPPANAGGPCGLDVDPDGPEVKALKAWRAAGAKALPKVLEALCAENQDLAALALFRLQELGSRAVEPLLTAATQQSACLDIDDDGLREDVDAFGEVLCGLGERELEDPVTCAKVRPKRTPTDVKAAVTTLNAWLVHAADPHRRAALQAIEAFGRRFDMHEIEGREEGCRARDALSRAFLPTLRKRLKEERPELRPAVVRAVGALGVVAAPAVPDLLPLLDDPGLSCDAAVALGRIGGAASSAIPAMAKLLQGRATICRLEVLEALARMGPAPDILAPAVDSFLGDLAKEPCGQEDSLKRASRALTTLGAAAAPSVHHLLSALDKGCPGAPALEILLTAKTLKTAGPGGEVPLRSLLRARKIWLSDRLLAAEVLQATGGVLSDDEKALVAALDKKHGLRRPPVASQLPPPDLPPAEEARDGATEALRVCRQEVGLSPPAEKDVPPLPASPAEMEQLRQLAACLNSDPCGPKRVAYRQMIEQCCRRAYPGQVPGWCKAKE